MIHSRNNKPAFTLTEVLIALTIFALVATPLFVTEGVIVRGVARTAGLEQRIFLAENFLIDAGAEAGDAQNFTLEKKIPMPETQLKYVRAPVESKSIFKAHTGFLVEKVTIEWLEMGQKKSETITNFINKPERKQQ